MIYVPTSIIDILKANVESEIYEEQILTNINKKIEKL